MTIVIDRQILLMSCPRGLLELFEFLT